MTEAVLFIAFLGHVLCGVTDCLLGFTKSGRISLKNIDDNEKMSAMFADYKINNALASMLLGVVAISAFTFGYIELSRLVDATSHVCGVIMYISAVIAMVVLVVHHVFCGAVFWFYMRLGRTAEAREAVLDFFKKTAVTMIAGYIVLGVFLVTFFIAVVSGQTELPQWACVFNTVPLMILLAPTKLPAKGNIAGAVMFLGLFIVMLIA